MDMRSSRNLRHASSHPPSLNISSHSQFETSSFVPIFQIDAKIFDTKEKMLYWGTFYFFNMHVLLTDDAKIGCCFFLF